MRKKPALPSGGYHEEFTCVDCGQRVVRWSGCDRTGEPKFCAICLHFPGWMDDPVMAKRFGVPPSYISG